MLKTRKKSPNVWAPLNFTKQGIPIKRVNTSSKTMAKGRKKLNKIVIPPQLEIAFSQTLSVLSDTMVNSTFEAELATQLRVSYMQHLYWGNEVSYENLFEHVASLEHYLDYKQFNKNENPLLALALKNFSSAKIPMTCEEILAALMLHHLAGEKGMHLFDAFIYSSFLAAYHGKDKELQRLATEALNEGLTYLRSISEWNSSATMEMMFGGDAERISKPSSSPDEIISAVAEELVHSHSDKMEVSLPHEEPIGSTVVEPKGSTTQKVSCVHGNVTPAEPVPFQENGCDAHLEARLKVKYLEFDLILGASTSTSLDKHLKRKLSDRYLDFTNNVKGSREKFQTAMLNIQAYLEKRGDLMDPLASKSSISPTDPTPVQSLSLNADTLEHNNTIKHELGAKMEVSLELTRHSVETSSPTSLSSFDNESLSSQSLSPLCLPFTPERVSPVYYEEDDDEVADPSLLDDYVLMELEQATTTLPESVDAVNEVPSNLPVSSSPSSFSNIHSWKPGEEKEWYSIPLPQLKLDPLLLLKHCCWVGRLHGSIQLITIIITTSYLR